MPGCSVHSKGYEPGAGAVNDRTSDDPGGTTVEVLTLIGSPNVKLCGTTSRFSNVSVTGAAGRTVYLHSRYQPAEEAATLIDATAVDRCVAFHVHGFGLGHHVQALFERASAEAMLFVFEPDLAMLRTAFEQCDHSNLIESRRVVFVWKQDKSELFLKLTPHTAMLSMGFEAVNHPDDPAAGTRRLRFGREIYIEQDDFMENPPKKFFRLSPGSEVRLRYAYFITCREVVKDAAGNVVELRCTYDPATKGGNAPDGRKVKATIHWVSAHDAIDAEVRLYDVLSTLEHSDDVPAGRDWKEFLNPGSLEVLRGCKLEAALGEARPGERFQFERMGYFCVDIRESRPGQPVFNRTVTLKDRFAKQHGR